MVAVRLLVPTYLKGVCRSLGIIGHLAEQHNATQTWQAVHPELLGGQADAHISVASLGDYPHLEVVESAGGRDRIGSAHGGGITVLLANT